MLRETHLTAQEETIDKFQFVETDTRLEITHLICVFTYTYAPFGRFFATKNAHLYW